MLLDRTHRSWAFLSAVILATATASYVVYAEMSPRGPAGGSLMGLIYGVAGSACMIFAGLLAGRKQVPFWRLGSAQFWLRGHLWLGTLSVPLILFHAGFGLGGQLEQLLWLFFAIVVLSGFFGLAMQHILPRLMTSQIPRETFVAQIPYVRKRNRLLSDRMVATVCGRIPIRGDSLQPQLERLVKFAADLQSREKSAKGKAEKDKIREIKATWTEQLDAEDVGLFRDIARFAKSSGWCRTENDFSTLLLDVYDIPGISPATDASASAAPAPPTGSPATAPQDAAEKKTLSPLEQMKARQAAGKSKAADSGTAPRGGKPSPLDMIRSGSSPKPAAKEGDSKADMQGSQPSPLDLIRAKSGRSATAGDTVPQKTASEDTSSESAAVLSGTAKASPLDLIRQQSSAAARSSASLPSDKPADQPVVSKATGGRTSKKPDPVLKTVSDVEAEVDAVRSVLRDTYGYSDEKADAAAEQTRRFLQTEAEAANREAAQAARESAAAAKKAATKKMDQPAAASPPAGKKAGPASGSPLDLIRQNSSRSRSAEGGKSAEGGTPAAGSKPSGLSPLELMKAKASGGGKAAKGSNPDKPKPPPAPRKAAVRREILRTEELRDFYLGTVRPFLAGDGRQGRLADATESLRAFTQMRATLPVELHRILESLQLYCDEHRQFSKQYQLHRWLHYWLALHIPFSIGLLVLFVFHVVMSLRVVPWNFPFKL